MSEEHVEADCCKPGGCCSGCCCLRCCCKMPHGKGLTLVANFVTTINVILSICVVSSCVFLDSDDSFHYDGIFDCWGYSYYDENTGPYTEVRKNAAVKTARVCSILAVLIGAGVMCALWPATCMAYRRVTIRWLVLLLLSCSFAQFLTLLMLKHDACNVFHCKLGWAGVLSVLTAISWLIAAGFVAFLPASETLPEESWNDNLTATSIATVAIMETRGDGSNGTSRVVTTRTTTPTGTVVITTETIDVEGKNTVKTSTENNSPDLAVVEDEPVVTAIVA